MDGGIVRQGDHMVATQKNGRAPRLPPIASCKNIASNLMGQ